MRSQVPFRCGLLALALALALASGACGGELPGVVREEIATTARVQPGAVTVVFFTDFECPYCRSTHARLAPLLASRRGRVRLVLRHVPLPRHPDAKGAARAAVCFEKLVGRGAGGAAGAGEAGVAQASEGGDAAYLDYAHALFESPDLSPSACAAMAQQRGIDRPRFDECVSDAATDAQIQRDEAMFDAVRGDGVPLLYVGKTRLEGAQPVSALASALDDASP